MSCAPREMTGRAAFAAHCDALGLSQAHTADELKQAYRRLMLQWHPDRHHGDAERLAAALARTQTITAANAYLAAAQSAYSGGQGASLQYEEPVRRTYVEGFPDATVLEVHVRAPNLKSVGYNSVTADLYLKFRGDRVYRARGVPRVVFEGLIAAPAPGAYADRHILSRYQTQRC